MNKIFKEFLNHFKFTISFFILFNYWLFLSVLWVAVDPIFSIFVFLTIQHPIGDFKMANRRFGIKHYSELKTRIGWKKLLTSEFFWVANPLHWLIDSSPLRKHGKYIINKKRLKIQHIITEEIYQEIDPLFWKNLGNDQFYHVIANLILAIVLGALF